MTNKHTLQRQKIIETAFKTWAEDSFYKTSLTTLAKALGVTKAALYRYFSSKDELLEAMSRELLRIHEELCEQVIREAEGKSFEERVRIFLNRFLRFYAENHWYYRFAFTKLVPHSPEGLEKSQQLEEMQRRIFPLERLARQFTWPGELLVVAQRYLFSSSLFLLHLWNFNKKMIGSLSLEKMLKINEKWLLEGMHGTTELQPVDFVEIEQQCGVRKDELLEPDFIFHAVAEVVAEEGLWKASLEKIARKAGMSKSSLYFYFKNRNDMLWKMIDRERHNVGRIFLQRIDGKEAFEDQLYAYFVVFSSYLNMRPEFLSVMNWFRFQRFQIQPPADPGRGMDQYLEFLENGIQAGKLRSDLFDRFGVLQWINFLIVQESSLRLCDGSPVLDVRELSRSLYKLFLFGMKGERHETE